MIDHNQAILKDEIDRMISFKMEEIARAEQMISIYEKDIEEKQQDIGKWKEQIQKFKIVIDGLRRMGNEI